MLKVPKAHKCHKLCVCYVEHVPHTVEVHASLLKYIVSIIVSRVPTIILINNLIIFVFSMASELEL